MPGQTIILERGDELTVRSSDGSPLNYTANPFHPDVLTLTVSGGGEITPPPQPGTFWIGAFNPAQGVIETRSSLSSGPAEGVIHPPDPYAPAQVVIADAVWSFNAGVWKGPAGQEQQFGQAGDTPLGGQFGSSFGKAVARIEDRYGSHGRVFKFGSGSYTNEYWLGAGHAERAFSHCWGEGQTPWFIGMIYNSGLWLIRAPHGSEKRLAGDFLETDWILSAHFEEGRAGLAVVRGSTWRCWYDCASLNPSHPDETFTFGDASAQPLACG